MLKYCVKTMCKLCFITQKCANFVSSHEKTSLLERTLFLRTKKRRYSNAHYVRRENATNSMFKLREVTSNGRMENVHDVGTGD